MKPWILFYACSLLAVVQPALAAPDTKKLVTSARSQVGVTLSYDPSYKKLDYPNGDVPMNTGVCTDVIIRAFRKGLNKDLQKLLHLDMKQNFKKYPQNWGLRRPDKNIDHRRVPNLKAYFKRQGWSLKVSKEAKDYKAGDIVTCKVGGTLPHIMIVSDKTTVDGVPLIIHNIGSGAQEEDDLFTYKITGHYRVK